MCTKKIKVSEFIHTYAYVNFSTFIHFCHPVSHQAQHHHPWTSNLYLSVPLPFTAEYMTLPASQYSVLDAKRIERIDDATFRCYVGGLNFLRFRVEPVLTVSVIVGDRGPTVRLLATQVSNRLHS